MKFRSSKQASFCAALLLALTTLLHAQSRITRNVTLHLDPVRTEIHWALPGALHTVHGTFRLKGGMTSFNPQTGAAQGEILVDVTSESGNPSRDSPMHKAVLESENIRRPSFTHQGDRSFESGCPADHNCGRHVDHPRCRSPPQAGDKSPGGRTRCSGNNAVFRSLCTWGMKDPSSTLLRVGKEVAIDVVAKGQVDGIL